MRSTGGIGKLRLIYSTADPHARSSSRSKLLWHGGNVADLQANVSALVEGEICYAVDENAYYQKVSGSLVKVTTGGAGGGGLEDAPSDGQEYIRKDGAWVVNTDETGSGGASPTRLLMARTTSATTTPGSRPPTRPAWPTPPRMVASTCARTAPGSPHPAAGYDDTAFRSRHRDHPAQHRRPH